MTRRQVALVAGLVAVASGVVGVAWWNSPRPADPSVDGWPLGAKGLCQLDGAYGDPAYDMVAIAARQVGEEWAASAEVRCYGEGAYQVAGKPLLMNRSGGLTIVVFTKPGGSRRAVALKCVGGCNVVRAPAY